MHSSSDKHQSKVERFLKLGYSRADIVRVLDSLRHDAQTNDILGELIKTGGHQASSTSTSSSTNAPATTSATPSPTAARHTGAHNGLPGGSAKSSRPPSSSSSSSSPQLVARGCGSPRAVSPSQSPAAPVDRNHASNFRPVVIDGSNVAMSHGNKQVFSCRGVQLAVKWFWDRGLRDITVFVPLWRKEQPRPETPITDQHILTELERKKILVFTPSRCVGGKRIVCYDDRYIVELAFASDGIIVSNDNYRDLQIEKPQWKKFIEDRLLMYTFANDTFMPPEDPLGRNGPTLDNFLRKSPTVPENKQPPCPYGKKCTYGVKCKYSHPERADQSQLSVADELRAKSRSAIEENQALHHQAPPTAYPALHPYPLGPSGTGLAGYSHGGRYSMLPHCVVGQETDGCSPALRPCSPRVANGSYTPSTGPDSGLSFGSDPWMPDVPPHHFHPYHQLEVPPRSAGSIATSSGVAGLSDLYSSASSSGRLDMDESLDHTHNTGLGHSRSERRYPHVTSEGHVIGGQGYPAAPGVSKGHRCGPSYPFHMQMPPLAHDGRCHSYDFVDHRSANPHYQQQYRPCKSMDEFWRPVSSPSPSDNRQVAKAHLSAIFPPDSVDHVMSLYPHVNDTTELVALMRKLKTTF